MLQLRVPPTSPGKPPCKGFVPLRVQNPLQKKQNVQELNLNSNWLPHSISARSICCHDFCQIARYSSRVFCWCQNETLDEPPRGRLMCQPHVRKQLWEINFCHGRKTEEIFLYLSEFLFQFGKARNTHQKSNTTCASRFTLVSSAAAWLTITSCSASLCPPVDFIKHLGPNVC